MYVFDIGIFWKRQLIDILFVSDIAKQISVKLQESDDYCLRSFQECLHERGMNVQLLKYRLAAEKLKRFVG